MRSGKAVDALGERGAGKLVAWVDVIRLVNSKGGSLVVSLVVSLDVSLVVGCLERNGYWKLVMEGWINCEEAEIIVVTINQRNT